MCQPAAARRSSWLSLGAPAIIVDGCDLTASPGHCLTDLLYPRPALVLIRPPARLNRHHSRGVNASRRLELSAGQLSAPYSTPSMAAPPSQSDVLATWGATLKASTVYRKVTPTLAKVATESGVQETVVKGEVETSRRYEKGEYIIQGPLGERYTVAAATFEARYDTAASCPADDEALSGEGFRTYLPIGKIWAHELTAAECAEYFPAGAFIAAWGEAMAVTAGDYIAAPHPALSEVRQREGKPDRSLSSS